MNTQIRTIEYKLAWPRWLFPRTKTIWRVIANTANFAWQMMMGNHLERQIGPDQRPELVDATERWQYKRGLGPWL